MTDEQNERLDIRDPRDRQIEPADEVAVDTESGDGSSDDSGGLAGRDGGEKDAPEPEDLSEFLDEVAGKRILDLQREIKKLQQIAAKDLGGRPDWVTFTPDSKSVYIATENRNAVVAIDVAARKELAKIPVGDNPKRNITMVMGGR